MAINELEGVQVEIFSRVARDARSKFFLEAEVTQTGTISEDLKNPEDQTDLDVFFYVVVKPERSGAHFSFDILTDKVVMMSLGVILIIIGLALCCLLALIYCLCCQDADEEQDGELHKLNGN